MIKKTLLLLIIFGFSLFVSAQTEEKQYYIYNIFSLPSNLTSHTAYYLTVDDGMLIYMLRDENDKRIKFNTPAAALMYLFSMGWELYQTCTTQDQLCWIMRRPCTKDEFDKAVKKGIW